MGLLLAIVVGCPLGRTANAPDRDGACAVPAKLAGRFPRLRLIWADGGYNGQVAELVKLTWDWTAAVRFAVLSRCCSVKLRESVK